MTTRPTVAAWDHELVKAWLMAVLISPGALLGGGATEHGISPDHGLCCFAECGGRCPCLGLLSKCQSEDPV